MDLLSSKQILHRTPYSAHPHPERHLQAGIDNPHSDGFYIAGEDLKLRGPGDFFGIRQSGDYQFRLADVFQDADVLRRRPMKYLF